MISMMDFFMHCCKKIVNKILGSFLLAMLLATCANAAGIVVNKASVRPSDDGYHLSANYDINLTLVMQQALSRGIALHFVGEFTLTHSRWYWLDEEIFRSEQSIKLSYNVLTRQYRISRGSLFQNFTSFEDALNTLSRQNSPAIPKDVIDSGRDYFPDWVKKEGKYFAAARLRLDTAQLPKLMQVNAFTDSDWSLSSDWYRWIVTPAEIAVSGLGKLE
jgi:hypothetical protein